MVRKFIYAILGIRVIANPAFAVREADYVIVGLGTAEAILARYLSDPVKGVMTNP